MLLADSSGTKYPPMLVYKCNLSKVPQTAAENIRQRNGFSVGMWRDMQCLQTETGMHIYCNPKGWFNEDLAINFLRHYFAQRENPSKRILLLWDDFSGHWTPEVNSYAKSINVFLEKVPPNCTAVCQPADIALNEAAKR
ncbi:unnamed protein product [Phytophthora fragariaefolia]|uniref:Unnamed protein product n=1 Tax=Phytophthora fragariaefolia TaxID=1490495 RepID=A0A9W7D140_9STRA|nr:unnamed protein product [Phytophthora fragariaefolia]